jgi:hypothetical protein
MSLADPLDHFFFLAAAEVSNYPLSCVRSWLFQLIAKHRDSFELALKSAPNKDTDVAPTTEVWDVFSAIVHEIHNFTLVVDSLDESVQASNKQKQFLVELKCTVPQTASRVLVVSRDEVDI